MRNGKSTPQQCVICMRAPAARFEPIWPMGADGNTTRARARAPLCAACTLQRGQLAVRLAGGLHFDVAADAGPSIAGAYSGAPILCGRDGAPFDGELLNRFFAGAARCLLWHHWSVILTPQHGVKAWSLTRLGATRFDRVLARAGTHEALDVNLSGAFGYASIFCANDEFSAWLFTLPTPLAFVEDDGEDGGIVAVGVAAGNRSRVFGVSL